jgi:hypothetical protein
MYVYEGYILTFKTEYTYIWEGSCLDISTDKDFILIISVSFSVLFLNQLGDVTMVILKNWNNVV